MLMQQLTRRFFTTGRPLQTKRPNRKQRLGWYEVHNHGEDLHAEKIMSKPHFVGSLLALSVAGYGFSQYIMSTQKNRVKKKTAEIEI